MKGKNVSISVYFIVVLAMLFWSLSYIWLKVVYRYLNPIETVFLRVTAAAVLLFIYALVTKKLQKIEKGDWKGIILMSVFQPFGYFLFESFGIKMVSPTVAAVIISIIPVFIPVAAFYFFKERLSLINIVGIIISFAGVLMVILKGDLSLAASPLGILLLFMAVITGVAFTITVKKLVGKYTPLTLVAYQNILGILGFLPMFLIFDLDHLVTVEFNGELLLNLGMLVVFATSLSFMFYTEAVKKLGASQAGFFTNFIPAFTALFAWWLLGEPMTMQKIVGIFVVIGGVFVAQLKIRKNVNTGE